MSHQIEISGTTGTSPYDIYLCDITNSYCYLMSGSTSIPPSVTFIVHPPLDDVNSLLIKLVDFNGCEIFHYYEC